MGYAGAREVQMRAGCVVVLLLTGGVSWAQPTAGLGMGSPGYVFVEVAEDRGISGHVPAAGMAHGLAAADYDNDGDIDLLLPTEEGHPPLLFRNRGDGFFDEVGVDSGLTWDGRTRGALMADLNGDDLLDVILMGDCFAIGDPTCPGREKVRVYVQQPDHSFVDVTKVCGIAPDDIVNEDHHRGTINAGDVNGDGWLDLFTALWSGGGRLLLNNGRGGFVDVTKDAGFAVGESHFWQSVLYDADADGDLDIFSAIDFAPNVLWLNDGSGIFRPADESAGVGIAFNDMGVSLGDFDNDQDFDIAITEIYTEQLKKHGVLLRRDGPPETPVFVEIGEQAGVMRHGWGWGVTFCDFDLDGWQDLLVTGGFNVTPYDTDPTRLYHNLGPGQELWFEDIAPAVGMDDREIAGGIVAFDMDRDGDLDVAQVTYTGGVRLLEHRRLRLDRHWITIQPRSDGPNRRAIGAVVQVRTGDLTQTRLITAGTSLLSQEPAEAHFGLGASRVIDEVRVLFPDGSERVLRDVAADQVLVVR